MIDRTAGSYGVQNSAIIAIPTNGHGMRAPTMRAARRVPEPLRVPKTLIPRSDRAGADWQGHRKDPPERSPSLRRTPAWPRHFARRSTHAARWLGTPNGPGPG